MISLDADFNLIGLNKIRMTMLYVMMWTRFRCKWLDPYAWMLTTWNPDQSVPRFWVVTSRTIIRIYNFYNHPKHSRINTSNDQNSGCGGRRGQWKKCYVAVVSMRSSVNFLSGQNNLILCFFSGSEPYKGRENFRRGYWWEETGKIVF